MGARNIARGILAVTALRLLMPAPAPSAPQEPRAGGRPPVLEDVTAAGLTGIPDLSALEGVRLDPALRGSLDAALRARDYTKAETLLVDEITKQPKSPELLALAGRIFFLDGKYLNSAIAFKKADAITPLEEKNRFTLAMAYIVLDHRDWARPEIERLAKAAPRNPQYPYWLGRLDYDGMHFTAAVEQFQRALRLDPGTSKAEDNLGLCYEALGRYDEAVESYRKAVALNRQPAQSSPWPPLNLGKLLLKLGRLDEAEGILRESLRADARLAETHYQLGLLLEKRQKDSEAARELEQAAALKPDYAEPHYVLGRIYKRSGETNKAQAEWQTFQKIKEEHPDRRPH